jgi:hypothetical protein
MKRENYRNGDSIDLPCGCNGCNPMMIQGVLCHEQGCPEEWRDIQAECFECGCGFWREDRWQRTCNDCLNPEQYIEEPDNGEEDEDDGDA